MKPCNSLCFLLQTFVRLLLSSATSSMFMQTNPCNPCKPCDSLCAHDYIMFSNTHAEWGDLSHDTQIAQHGQETERNMGYVACENYGGRESSTRCKQKKHLQIKKTTSSIWQHMRCKCPQHKQIKKHTANKILYLVVFWAFAAPAVKLMKMFSWFAGAFSICMCFLKL